MLEYSQWYPSLTEEDPIGYLPSSNNLNVKEFAYIIPARTIELLLRLGSIAGQSLRQEGVFKLLKRDPYVINAFLDYLNQDDVFPTPKESSTLDLWRSRLDLAIDSETTGIDGLKECYLVSEYYERIYHRAHPTKGGFLENNIYKLDYELPPYYDIVEIKDGDQFIFDRTDNRFEKNWPDVMLRDGKYSIVHHFWGSGNDTITTQSAVGFDDVRMPVTKRSLDVMEFLLCKRSGKWGAIYSNGFIFMNTVVPFEFETPEMAAKEIEKLLPSPIETKWVSWDEFKGYFA